MAGIEKYEVLIIGGGQAGIPLARGLAGTGKRVALVERKDLGGSCINFGCTPTKAAIAFALRTFLSATAESVDLNEAPQTRGPISGNRRKLVNHHWEQ
ncbi:MAG: FAD-dependent oxidoreductase [Rhodomicrobium sp.]